ncbi:MAG TPA: YIP1 family protein [Candidatus Limnocylindria bacterium]|nr:YIP1 family protein [Candidatus Limnocylindria bacterium]
MKRDDSFDRLIPRLIGAAKLDPAIYEEIEGDRSGTPQAAFVIVATSIAAGVAGSGAGSIGSLLAGLAAIVGWAIQAWIVFFVGTTFFRVEATKADWGEVARTIGFAQTPRLFLLLAVVPGLGPTVTSLVGLWVLVATVVAIRAALDLSTGRAVGTAIASALFPFVLFYIVYLLFFSS